MYSFLFVRNSIQGFFVHSHCRKYMWNNESRNRIKKNVTIAFSYFIKYKTSLSFHNGCSMYFLINRITISYQSLYSN